MSLMRQVYQLRVSHGCTNTVQWSLRHAAFFTRPVISLNTRGPIQNRYFSLRSQQRRRSAGERLRGFLRPADTFRCVGRLEKLFADIDVLLCPSQASPPFPVTREMQYGPIPDGFLQNADYARFTGVFDFSGTPTLSLPCGFIRTLPTLTVSSLVLFGPVPTRAHRYRVRDDGRLGKSAQAPASGTSFSQRVSITYPPPILNRAHHPRGLSYTISTSTFLCFFQVRPCLRSRLPIAANRNPLTAGGDEWSLEPRQLLLVCTSHGPAVYRRTPVEEEDRTAPPGDQRADQRPVGPCRTRRDCGTPRPHASRVGQLLLLRIGQPRLSCCGLPRA